MQTPDIINDGNFKVEESTRNEMKQAIPDCIKRLRPPNPERKPLTDSELAEAKLQIWNHRFCTMKFPRERRLRTDPDINGQTYGIISFMPSPTALPDKQGCYGVIKLRGNFSSVQDAEGYGKFLLRKHDSYADYDLVRVGQEFPLMIDNSAYTEENCEVNIKAIVDDISLSYIKKKKAEERAQREEVEDRHRKLVSKTSSQDEEESIDDLEYYTTLRAKKAHCQWVIDENRKKISEAREALVSAMKEIASLDEKHPEYQTQFKRQYEKGLESVGTKMDENPLLAYMKKDVEEYKDASKERIQDYINTFLEESKEEEEKRPLA